MLGAVISWSSELHFFTMIKQIQQQNSDFCKLNYNNYNTRFDKHYLSQCQHYLIWRNLKSHSVSTKPLSVAVASEKTSKYELHLFHVNVLVG